MALDDWDAAVGGVLQQPTPGVTDDPFGKAVESVIGEQKTRVASNLQAAVRTNPDQAAQAKQIAKRRSIPDEAVLRNLRDVQMQDAVDRAWDKLNGSPLLESKMQDRIFAMMAHDDVPTLAELEASIAKFGELQTTRGPQATLGSVLSGLAQAPVQGARLAKAGIDQQFADLIGSEEGSRRAARSFASAQTDTALSTPEFDSSTAQGLYSGGTSLLRQIPGLAASIATRSATPALAAAGIQTEAEAYGKYRARGADPFPAFIGAVGEGAVEVGTEVMPMGFMVKQFGRAGAGEFLKGLLGREIPGEQVATFLQDSIDTAVANPDKSWEDFLRERPGAAYQTLLATLVQTGTIGGISAAAKGLADRQQRAQAAQQGGQAVAEVMTLAKTSKLRERDPQAFAEHVQAAADQAGTPAVYVDATMFAQSLAKLPEAEQVKLAEAMPKAIEALAEGVATGGDIAVPLGEFTTLAGTPLEQSLAPLVRTDPDAWTQAEADAFGKDGARLLQQEAEQVLAQSQRAAEFIAQTEAVQTQVMDQLKKARRFTDEVNAAYAGLVRDFYTVMAERLVTTPDALFAQHPLRIVAENPAQGGAVLSQPDDQRIQAIADAAASAVDTGKRSPLTGKAIFSVLDAEGNVLEQVHIASSADEALQLLRDRPARRAHSKANPPPPIYAPPKEKPQRSKWKIFRGEVGSHLDPDEFYYHVTTYQNARAILQDGLMPDQGSMFGGVYAGHSRGRVFLTDRDGVNFWREKVEAQLQHRSDNPPAVAVVRIPKADVQGAVVDEIGTKDAGAKAYYVEGRTLAQGEAAPRGTFDPGTNTIALLKGADLSTFLHELGHFYLETVAHLAADPAAPAQVQADMRALLEWFGHKGTAAEWLALPLDKRRDAHEKFARGFEAYLFEGKAPNIELQSLFQRFRAWLVQVYKSITALNVELTDEVRGVMNRLIATDAQIAEAQAAAGFAPMFETAEAAGMTPQQFVAYQALANDATEQAVEKLQRESLRDMRWLSNAKGRELKRLQADAKAKRDAMQATVADEVGRQPLYMVDSFLRRGRLPDGLQLNNAQRKALESFAGMKAKLDLGALKVMYGEGPAAPWRYLPVGKGGLAAAEGVHPNVIAEVFGFSSGDHLVRSLLAADPQAEVVEGLTDQRMLETYGDLTNEAALERAAEAAIHNEARGRFVAAELKALGRMLNVREATPGGGSVNVLARQAKAFAKAITGRKLIRDIRPAQHRAAETRAGRQAAEAMKKGDTQGAAAAKRNELLNHYAARTAADALAEVDKAVAYLTGINLKGLDVDYADQIDAILDRYDLRRSQSLTAIDKRKTLAQWVEAQREQGFDPTVDPALIEAAQRQHYKDLPLDTFRGVVDTVRNIEHLGRLKKKLLTAKDQREFAAAVADAEASIRANARGSRSKKYGDEGGAIGETFRGVLAMHRKFASMVREMDGFKDGGALWEVFVRPMNEAGDREAGMREAATIELTKVFAKLDTKALRRRESIPEIGDSLTREQMVSVALNWGNEANRARVMQGDGWSEAQVQAILARLEKHEWDFVQAVWDHVDTYWPAIKEKERRLTGTAPEKVEAAPIATKFGEYKGGYYPIKYDPTRSTKAEADTAAEVAKQMMGGAYTRATTRRGHTKARVEEVVGRPVRKDLGVVFEHVNQVAHDISWHEWLIDAQRLLRAKPIDAAIREHYGPEVLREMRKAIEDMAAGDVPAQDHLERAMNHIRVGTTVAGLGWNLMTSLLQPIGLTQSMVRIGPAWVAKGLAAWVGSPVQSLETINAKSEFMRLRAKTQQRELNEILNVVKGKRLTQLEASYFWMIQTAQKVADVPTWLGAYEKAQAEGNDEARSVALADQAVIDAQGGGQIKDLARVQRGGVWMKLWTNFYSFFNVLHNLSAESLNRTDFKSPASVALLMRDYLLLYTIPALMATLLKHALTGGDDDELAKKLAADQLTYLTGTILGVRETSAGIQGALGLYSDYSGPAGARFFAELAKLGKQAGQGEADAAFLKALNNTAGIALHYPAGQVQRTVAGFEALRNGETRNPLALLVGPPK